MEGDEDVVEVVDGGWWRIRVGRVSGLGEIIVVGMIRGVEVWFVEWGVMYRREME